jgi:1,4-alpha-glucan branching enzyme
METAFTWDEDRLPRTPWHETVVYETHVKGFTRRHPDESVSFHLGGRAQGLSWELVLDTPSPHTESRILERLDDYLLQSRSLTVLRPELPASARI